MVSAFGLSVFVHPTATAAAGLAALFTALVLTPWARRLAARIGFLDRPHASPHKEHDHPIPYGGGAALILSIGAGIGIAWAGGAFNDHPETTTTLAWILALTLIVFTVGLVDDLRPLNPYLRLVVHAACAFGVWMAGASITIHVGSRWFSLALTVLWITGLTNALNLLDHMDGLASGVGAIAAAVLLYPTLALIPQPASAAALAALAGACLGFLVYNRHPASIFMGDAGSTSIGFLLASLSVLTVYYQGSDPAASPAVAVALPVLVLAVPIYDTASVFLIRLREKRPLLRGDRRHTSHRLVELGLSVPRAVSVLYLFTLAMGLGGLQLVAAGFSQIVFGLAQGAVIVAIVALLMAIPPKKQPPSGTSSDGV